MAGRKKTKSSKTTTPKGKKAVLHTPKGVSKDSGFSEYFRISESYTSLILGIVVVIIASVLLISFLRGNELKSTPQAAPEISSAKIEPDATEMPVADEAVDEVPTTVPTVAPVADAPMVTPTSERKPAGTYTVQAGDDLWKIAEKTYNDGYKWTVIAEANNISNPGMIFSGNVLKIPAVSKSTIAKVETQQAENPIAQHGTITGSSYIIKRGDTLWSIAERRYNNGYRWVDIAKANNLTTPGVIHADNVLQFPN